MRKWIVVTVLALVLVAVARRAAIVGPDFCNGCDPTTSWTCWLLGCPDPKAAGGGSSGAS
jgi:hypothetical protein